MRRIAARSHGDMLPLHDGSAPNGDLYAFRREPAQRRTDLLIATLRNRDVAWRNGNGVRLRRLCAPPRSKQESGAFAEERRADADGDEADQCGSAREHRRSQNAWLINAVPIGNSVCPL